MTGGANGAMRLWNVSDHHQVNVSLPSHKGSVIDVDFSHDGKRIASMSYLVASGPAGSATVTDGQTTDATQLRITDASSGAPIIDGSTELGYGGNDLVLSRDGRRVAIGACDGKIHVLDANTGAAVGPPMSGHTGAVTIVAFSGDGTRIVSAGDTTIHVWATEPDTRDRNSTAGLAFSASLPAAVQSRRTDCRDS